MILDLLIQYLLISKGGDNYPKKPYVAFNIQNK